MQIDFGTHKTIITAGAQRLVIWHMPPLDPKEVLRNIARQKATSEGRLTPREPYFDGVESGQQADLNADNVTNTFVDALGRVRPVSGLTGASIACIIAGKPFGNVSPFAVALYKEAYASLLAEKKINKIIRGGFDALVDLFIPKVRELVQGGFRRRYQADINRSDVCLIGALGGKSKPAKSGKKRGINPRQMQFDFESMDLLTLDFSKLPNVKDSPLIRSSTGAGAEGRKIQQGQVGTNKCTRPVRDSGNGCYTDFSGHCRGVPPLNPQTIFGILNREGALDKEHVFQVESYAEIAKDASMYRRQQSVGGGNICPASAEFVIRVFRVIGLTTAQLQKLAVEDLAEVYNRYVFAKRDE